MLWTRLAQVVEAKNVRVGDYVLVATGEYDSANPPAMEWKCVTDADSGYSYNNVQLSYGDGWENQCGFDARDRLLVIQK